MRKGHPSLFAGSGQITCDWTRRPSSVDDIVFGCDRTVVGDVALSAPSSAHKSGHL